MKQTQDPRFFPPFSTRGQTIAEVVQQLCGKRSCREVMHTHHHDVPLPSVEVLGKMVDDLRAVLFPGYFGTSELKPDTMHYYLGSALDQIARNLAEQINRGMCFDCQPGQELDCKVCDNRAAEFTDHFLSRLPQIRESLASDIQAAYEGDPAARHPGEAIFCYPSIKEMTSYRIAHELHVLGVPLIPRIITEIAHGDTGIDIHPGAKIGKRFFMDHGTGVVIGETTVIGDNVRLYQGVTLGARSFPKDENGNPIKGIARHPIVENDVIIYSGATILGRVTIGRGAVIGGNVWLTKDVPAGSRIIQSRYQQMMFENGGGI